MQHISYLSPEPIDIVYRYAILDLEQGNRDKSQWERGFPYRFAWRLKTSGVQKIPFGWALAPVHVEFLFLIFQTSKFKLQKNSKHQESNIKTYHYSLLILLDFPQWLKG